MKFLVYSHSSGLYGAGRSILELSLELKRKGHEIQFIVPEIGPLPEVLSAEQIKYFILPNPSWDAAPWKKGYNRWYYFKHRVKSILIFLVEFFTSFRKHLDLVKVVKPDWVIINTSVAPIGLFVSKLKRIRTVLWIREPILNKKGWNISALFPKNILKIA